MQSKVMEGFRLSPQQRRLWALQDRSNAFTAQCAFSIEGALEPETLELAIRHTVNRHEILRTTFHCLPGVAIPVQVVSEQIDLSWHHVDLSDHGPEEQQHLIEAHLLESRRERFDFERSPLLRLSLIALSSTRHVLIFSLPALCADVCTLKNIFNEMISAYFSSTSFSEQPEELLPYSQFAQWQNDLLEDESSETDRPYWRNKNHYPFTELKFASSVKGVSHTPFESESFPVALDTDLVKRLDAIAEKHNTTIAVVLLACWQALLWRLTGEPEIVTGDAYHGRDLEMLAPASGLFTKWLPIHCHFEDQSLFSETIYRIDEARRQAHSFHEGFTFDHDATQSSLEQPFFPIGFEFNEFPSSRRANGVTFAFYKHYCYTERFDLKLSCLRLDDSLMAEFHYDPRIFDQGEVGRLGNHFRIMLDSALRDTGASISELEILSEAERHHLLIGINGAKVGRAHSQCIHELFEEQAARTPHNIALAFMDMEMDYAELNSRANQVAHYLKRLGAGPETLVGLCMQRSLEMIIGLLGTLKAGGAYVPLDPAYPKERLALMMDKTQIVLTQQSVLSNLPCHAAQVVCLDSSWDLIARESDENPVSETSPESLAYVIYTSGSTGKPRGVMIQHHSVVNLAASLDEAIYDRYPAPLRVSLNAPLVFDSSVKQLVQLFHGHALYILPEEVRPDGLELLAYVNRYGLNVLDCTPSQLKLLLECRLTEGKPSALRAVLVGGEPIDETTWELLSHNEHIDFYNLYGPTECTVDTSACRVSSSLATPTIGRALANNQIYMLDKRLNPTPIGIPGELHIGGDHLGRGYFNLPDLTAEKFIPNPFSEQPGTRLYKTGDLACYLPDGNIKFLTRIDHQVKLFGFRIELGEIETALCEHEAIKEAVVLVREDRPGDKRLVAYVVTHHKQAVDVIELLTFLRARLPRYMVPALVLTLPALPLTRNGKVDRQSLPSTESLHVNAGSNYVEPGTETQRIIANIWRKVLQVERVGIHDNFFDLGGNSLSMARVHNELRQAFKKEISIVEMFNSTTVSSLTSYLTRAGVEQPNFEQAAGRARLQKNVISRQREKLKGDRNAL